MNKAIKDFIEMMEGLDYYDDIGKIVFISPEYKALKALLEQKIVVTDELVTLGSKTFLNKIHSCRDEIKLALWGVDVSHWIKPVLEAVFDMVNKESANNAQCKKKICDGCKGDLTKNVCECEWLEEKPLDDGWIYIDMMEEPLVPMCIELDIKLYGGKIINDVRFNRAEWKARDVIAYRIISEPDKYCSCKPMQIDYMHRKVVDGTICNGCKLPINPEDKSYNAAIKPTPK